jgi:hypothetical protein
MIVCALVPAEARPVWLGLLLLTAFEPWLRA